MDLGCICHSNKTLFGTVSREIPTCYDTVTLLEVISLCKMRSCNGIFVISIELIAWISNHYHIQLKDGFRNVYSKLKGNFNNPCLSPSSSWTAPLKVLPLHSAV